TVGPPGASAEVGLRPRGLPVPGLHGCSRGGRRDVARPAPGGRVVDDDAVAPVSHPWPRLKRFYEQTLWTEDLSTRGPFDRSVIRLLRAVTVAVAASQDRLLNLHAMRLVYSTLLSLVPFLAVAFSVLKAFGAQYRLEPLVARILQPLGPQAAELTGRVVESVSRMNVGVLGALGLAGLFYTAL